MASGDREHQQTRLGVIGVPMGVLPWPDMGGPARKPPEAWLARNSIQGRIRAARAGRRLTRRGR